ncbi:TetR/AcrR family transcriptional regulator [Companilactobacillus baiquanensis]|uniref:TetR/AcrR family transcriptional regulator n=1 Tax=Companilactobacillus baiquanensis TaxID=2486005 RepID=A0ABW1UZ30_9LACO|nr:TetR/AcrR family transcriptional regulator [Companilactobacillus baiquanensis]
MAKDVRKIKTERDIQQALLKLLESKTFRQVTVADICQVSLTSRSTFYAHYLDKYDLLDKMVDNLTKLFAGRVNLRFDQIIKGDTDSLVRGLLKDMGNNRDAIIILFTIHEPSADLEANFKSLLLQKWKDFIKDSGSDTGVPIDLLASMGMNLQMTVIEWALAHGVTEMDAVAAAVNTIRESILIQIQPDK